MKLDAKALDEKLSEITGIAMLALSECYREKCRAGNLCSTCCLAKRIRDLALSGNRGVKPWKTRAAADPNDRPNQPRISEFRVKGNLFEVEATRRAGRVRVQNRAVADLAGGIMKSAKEVIMRRKRREAEYCDDCGERVGFYDRALPEGEKIVITRRCSCVREAEALRLARLAVRRDLEARGEQYIRECLAHRAAAASLASTQEDRPAEAPRDQEDR